MFTISSEKTKARAVSPRAVALSVMAILLALTLFFVSAGLRFTYVTDSDGASRLLLTSESDPNRLMSLSGIEAGEGDMVYYTAYSGSLATLNIERAFTVNVLVDGMVQEVNMVFGTVEDALERAGVVLGEFDYTVPETNSLVAMGSEIEVHRVEYTENTEYQAIPYETEYIYSSANYRNKNQTTTIRQGTEGQRAVTTRSCWLDGELQSTEVISDVVTTEPVSALVKAYSASAPVSSRTGPDGTTNKPTSYTKVLTGKATGYYAKSGRGASGLGLGYGTVAVDPRVIPYGTLLYIESTDGQFVYGYAIATDTGSAMRSGKVLVDLFYETYAEALANGVINVNVYVVG